MTTNPEKLMLDAWKQQSETWLRVIHAMTEGAEKVRAAQLAVASDANAGMPRVEKSVADAENPVELWNVELAWTMTNLEKSAAYWRSLFDACNETNARIWSCLGEQAQASGSRAGEASPALGAITAAYGEMFRNSQRMFAMTTEAFTAASKLGTAAAARPKARKTA